MVFKNTPSQGSIMHRLIVRVTALTALTIAVLALLSLVIAHSLVRKSTLSDIAAFSSVAEESVENSLQDARGRTVFLAGGTDVREMLAQPEGNHADAAWTLALGQDPQSLPVLGFDLRSAAGVSIVHVGQEIDGHVAMGSDTSVTPFVTPAGMTVYDVRTPVRDEHSRIIGNLSVRYDASAVSAKLASLALALGDTGEAMFAVPKNGDAFVFRPSTDARRFSLLPLSGDSVTPTLLALQGREGVAETKDDEGIDVFAGYRFLPDIGWGFVMTVERSEAYAEVSLLGKLIAAIGFFLLLLAIVVAIAFSRSITQPIRSLADKVSSLRPDHWDIARTIGSRDEVETLDRVFVDMAARLKKVYEDMEGVIRERTHKLAEQYALDRTILENISYAVIAVDAHANVTDANPAAAALLGISSADAKGAPVASVVSFKAHGGNDLPGGHPVLQCLRSKEAVHSAASAHWNIQRTDGTPVPVSCSVSPLIDKGNLFGAILVLQDVSEERRLDYLKSEFITLASHQLRTPLSALRWYVELMQEGGETLTDDQKGYMKEMGISLARMANLLESLLRASQMEENGLGISLAETNVNTLISETDEDFRSIAAEQHVTFSSSLPDTPVTAVTDPTLLRIVLQNLLSNATKYTRKDAHISLELMQSGDRYAITVTDEGMGIPLAEQPRVFQKFFRAKNVRKMDTDGNGLGLYITKSIVERLGGTIAFKSEEGKGTAFTVTFPLKAAVSGAKDGK